MLSKKVRGRNNVVIEKEHQFASRCSNAHIPGRACSAMWRCQRVKRTL
jgi:hypothetical protein